MFEHQGRSLEDVRMSRVSMVQFLFFPPFLLSMPSGTWLKAGSKAGKAGVSEWEKEGVLTATQNGTKRQKEEGTRQGKGCFSFESKSNPTFVWKKSFPFFLPICAATLLGKEGKKPNSLWGCCRAKTTTDSSKVSSVWQADISQEKCWQRRRGFSFFLLSRSEGGLNEGKRCLWWAHLEGSFSRCHELR